MVRRSLICFVSGVLFWLAGLLGALNDIDFFTLQDLRDTTQLHHEHLVALAAILGLVMFIAAAVSFLRELRTYTPPPYEADAGEKV